jgi:hypothetical protein
VKAREYTTAAQIFRALPLSTRGRSFRENARSSDVPPVDPWSILSDVFHVCARVCDELTWSAARVPSLAPGRCEKTRERNARTMRKSDSARGPRRCGTIAKRKRSRGTGGEGRGEEGEGEEQRSRRFEREAIRGCLMPRTKLCNYLYVRPKTIPTSASARARADT